jgi:hypothetical protein
MNALRNYKEAKLKAEKAENSELKNRFFFNWLRNAEMKMR